MRFTHAAPGGWPRRAPRRPAISRGFSSSPGRAYLLFTVFCAPISAINATLFLLSRVAYFTKTLIRSRKTRPVVSEHIYDNRIVLAKNALKGVRKLMKILK
ncbi:hypothetical protein SMZ18_003144 [Cronobacter dublinensis]|nr:hypothetical protein [Cronobacter dublinensis]